MISEVLHPDVMVIDSTTAVAATAADEKTHTATAVLAMEIDMMTGPTDAVIATTMLPALTVTLLEMTVTGVVEIVDVVGATTTEGEMMDAPLQRQRMLSHLPVVEAGLMKIVGTIGTLVVSSIRLTCRIRTRIWARIQRYRFGPLSGSAAWTVIFGLSFIQPQLL